MKIFLQRLLEKIRSLVKIICINLRNSWFPDLSLILMSRAAFLKLWSADHKWSSGSALVVLLD